MKQQAKKYIVKIFWSIVIIVFISSCSSDDDIIDKDKVLTEGNFTEILKNINTEWGTGSKTIIQHMKGYQQTKLSDGNILQFDAPKSPVTIAYQFSSDKLCAVAIKAKINEEKIDIQKSLLGFNYVGESSNNDIFSNNEKNVFAAAYETIENEEKHQIVGFTPLFAMTKKLNGQEYVDLGLSVKWSTCNIGSKKPEEYGGYYAWGEIEEKNSYTWSTYKYSSGSSNNCESLGDSINETQYDVAQAYYGKPWKMPTWREANELRTKCDWVWTVENGIKGYKVFGDNGNYIFLPAAGIKTTSLRNTETDGYYMTATQHKNSSSAYNLEFKSSKTTCSYTSRFCGLSVRAVFK